MRDDARNRLRVCDSRPGNGELGQTPAHDRTRCNVHEPVEVSRLGHGERQDGIEERAAQERGEPFGFGCVPNPCRQVVVEVPHERPALECMAGARERPDRAAPAGEILVAAVLVAARIEIAVTDERDADAGIAGGRCDRAAVR